MQSNISKKLDQWHLGRPQQYKSITMVPLFDKNDEDSGLNYYSLSKALKNGWVEIKEVSWMGNISSLNVSNKSSNPILIVDGEELAGAKQNRIVNTSILVPAFEEIHVPVSCTEQKRWSYKSEQFEDSEVLLAANARRNKNVKMSQSLTVGGHYDVDQESIWMDIKSIFSNSGVSSKTLAMKDAFDDRKTDINHFLEALPYQYGQKGAAIFVNGRLEGLDYISQTKAYKDLHPKLIKSHAMDVIHQEGYAMWNCDEDCLKEPINEWLRELGNAQENSYNPVGLGTDYRYDSDKIIGSVLYEKNPVHVSISRK